MISTRVKRYMQNIAGCAFFGALFAMGFVGCQESFEDEKRLKPQRLAEAAITPTPVGKPFLLDGCMVQLTRVDVQTPGLHSTETTKVTMATANCETAKVVATHETCGKDCVSDTVRVEPKLAKAPATLAQ